MAQFSLRLSPLCAALDQFDARLQASSSATRTLEQWLAERHGAAAAPLNARVRALVAPRVEAAVMRRLGVGDWGMVRYRRVWLVGGNRVMSVAENWYVAERLEEGMVAQLSGGGVPFGAVIASLGPTRETLASERLWDDVDVGAAGALPPAVLRHHALVRASDGTPLCEVSEVYTRNILL